MRPSILAAVLASFLASSCSSEAPYGTPPLFDLRMPKAAPADWALGSTGARLVPFADAHALFVPRGEAATVLQLPFGPGLAGARRVRVEYMSDGAFRLEGSLAGQACAARQGQDTKRQPNTLELELAAPVTSDAGTLELRCLSTQVPVLLMRVQAVP